MDCIHPNPNKIWAVQTWDRGDVLESFRSTMLHWNSCRSRSRIRIRAASVSEVTSQWNWISQNDIVSFASSLQPHICTTDRVWLRKRATYNILRRYYLQMEHKKCQIQKKERRIRQMRRRDERIHAAVESLPLSLSLLSSLQCALSAQSIANCHTTCQMIQHYFYVAISFHFFFLFVNCLMNSLLEINFCCFWYFVSGALDFDSLVFWFCRREFTFLCKRCRTRSRMNANNCYRCRWLVIGWISEHVFAISHCIRTSMSAAKMSIFFWNIFDVISSLFCACLCVCNGISTLDHSIRVTRKQISFKFN